ncbi:hypothetical protein [Streptomyces broussonetiae]|uniref:Uncharacterized protein n=1 Tax=Streptomyces broussonetiae TaxID=2686304 RepID=A0ABV5E5K6_9ACTN
MQIVTLGVLVAALLALPLLAIAFRRYCDTVNRLVRRKYGPRRTR